MNFPLREAAKEKVRSIKGAVSGVDFDATTGELYLDGDVGDDFTSRDVRTALKAIGNKKAKVYINSRGGIVTEGVAVFTALTEHAAGVDTYCAALAASIASLIFQAGERRFMFPSSLMMIHSPWLSMRGNSAEFEKQIEVLKKFEAQMVGVYRKRTSKSVEKIKQMLAAETWLTDQEAVSEGFADAVVGRESAKSKTMTLAEARALIARTPKVTIDHPIRTAARSKSVKLRIATDRILNAR